MLNADLQYDINVFLHLLHYKSGIMQQIMFVPVKKKQINKKNGDNSNGNNSSSGNSSIISSSYRIVAGK